MTLAQRDQELAVKEMHDAYPVDKVLVSLSDGALNEVRDDLGINRSTLAEKLSASLRTVDCLLAQLNEEGKVVRRGSMKTGGDYAL